MTNRQNAIMEKKCAPKVWAVTSGYSGQIPYTRLFLTEKEARERYNSIPADWFRKIYKTDDIWNWTEKQYKEVRKISAQALRQLCVDNNWYTAGDNDEYEHLLLDLAANKENLNTADIIEIAADIMEHSNLSDDCTIENIAFEVARIATTHFVRA